MIAVAFTIDECTCVRACVRACVHVRVRMPRASPLPLSGVVLSGAACAERRCMCTIGAACGHFWRGAV